jgi:sirohydrochlorin cobaltochelatase
MRGVVLLAHGARRAEWARPFEELASGLDGVGPVRLAFLEFMQPDLAAAVDALHQDGCSEIDVIPCFLGGAGHVLRDVPPLLDAAQLRHPHLRLRLHPALGEQAAMIAAMQAVCRQLLGPS